MRRVGFAQAFLDRCNFDSSVNDDQQKYEDSSNGSNNGNKQKTTVLNKIDFFFSEFSYCRFVRCKMNKVDFRYSKVSDCSMRELRVIYGDFYFCTFSGCSSFQASKFIECSFTNAVFENNVIRFRHIKGLLQDNPDKYFENVMAASKSKLKWFRYNPTGTFSNVKSSLKEESKEMFRLLSGIYASKGLNKDSNAAYREMKIRELRKSWQNIRESVCGLLLLLVLMGLLIYKLVGHINCTVVLSCLGVYLLYLLYDCIKDRIKKVLRHIGKEIEDIYEMLSGLLTFLMGYGYKWVNVIIVFVLLIFIGAAGYKNYDNCSWKDALNDSFNNIIGIAQKDCWGMFAGIHHLLGVLLIGYLGFIFANKMRNNL